MRILVTGGSGLVGNGIKDSIPDTLKNEREIDDIKIGDQQSDQQATFKLFSEFQPTHVIHCAAVVGGLYKNMDDNLNFLLDNLAINTNVLKASHTFNVTKVVSVLSTCIFPSEINSFPFDETKLHHGPPHSSNEGYSYAKRMLEVTSRLYRQQEKKNFVCGILTNVYGPNDNFHLKDAHVIPALIHKAYLAQQNDASKFLILGKGNCLRQFIYSLDVGKILIWMLENYDDEKPLMICEENEYSIKEIAVKIADNFDCSQKLEFDESWPEGQFKKTADARRLKQLLPDFEFTSLEAGLEFTCSWFAQNYDKCRK